MTIHRRMLMLALGAAIAATGCSGDEDEGTDASVKDTGTTTKTDSGTAGSDSGTTTPDSGTPGTDAGTSTTDGGTTTRDGGPVANACAEFSSPVTTISTYPATYNGTTANSGSQLSVAEGTCTDERSWYEQPGEDQVIALSGLTPGSRYFVRFQAASDISFYVATGCTDAAGGPSSAQCLLFVDEAIEAEAGDFTAPNTGSVFLVLDHYDADPPQDSTYTLNVYLAECSTDPDCTNAASPFCVDGRCVQCGDYFDCTNPATPVCDLGNQCVAGPGLCVGEEATGENGNDGPAGAVVINPPSIGNPSTVNASICSAPQEELDWYSFTLASVGSYGYSLSWADASVEMGLYILTADGNVVEQPGFGAGASPQSGLLTDQPAGPYYLVVVKFSPENDTQGTPYTLTLSLPECTNDFECTNAANPICDATGTCTTGYNQCVGDDSGENGNDGPAGAVNATPTLGQSSSTPAAICNAPDSELDYYSVTVGNGESLDISLSWQGSATAPDLDLMVFERGGPNGVRLLGQSFYVFPERVTLTHLPASTYYVMVDYFDPAGVPTATAAPYTLDVARTAGGCTTNADCATVYSNQIFRGSCQSGACVFIEGAGALTTGAACDSGDDCASGFCTYLPYEADAQKSVCSVACVADTDCASMGTDFVCSTVFQTNRCVPKCTANTDCGANTGSDLVDPSLPWDYLTCDPVTGYCTL